MKVYSYNREDGAGGKITLLVTTEFHGVEMLGDDDRELLRRQVADMVAQYTDDHFYNVFDDEVKEMLDLLNSGTIIGQPPVGVGEYRHGFYIWYHPTVEHEDGQYLRKDFTISETCLFDKGVFENKVEAMLTLYHYHTALVDDEAGTLYDNEPMYDMDGGYFHRDPTPEEEASYEKWLEECERTGADPSGVLATDLPDFIAP